MHIKRIAGLRCRDIRRSCAFLSGIEVTASNESLRDIGIGLGGCLHLVVRGGTPIFTAQRNSKGTNPATQLLAQQNKILAAGGSLNVKVEQDFGAPSSSFMFPTPASSGASRQVSLEWETLLAGVPKGGMQGSLPTTFIDGLPGLSGFMPSASAFSATSAVLGQLHTERQHSIDWEALMMADTTATATHFDWDSLLTVVPSRSRQPSLTLVAASSADQVPDSATSHTVPNSAISNAPVSIALDIVKQEPVDPATANAAASSSGGRKRRATMAPEVDSGSGSDAAVGSAVVARKPRGALQPKEELPKEDKLMV
jgi:hypothetical protein